MEHWKEQYEETAIALNNRAVEKCDDELRKLLRQAADDIYTLTDGLLQYEREEDEYKAMMKRDRPRFQNMDEILKSDYFPKSVEIPKSYYPIGVGPGSFDPKLMYAHSLALYSHMYAGMMTHEMKPWMVLWLFDHIDWKKVRTQLPCENCGKDKHGYQGPLCRYCDPNAYTE